MQRWGEAERAWACNDENEQNNQVIKTTTYGGGAAMEKDIVNDKWVMDNGLQVQVPASQGEGGTEQMHNCRMQCVRRQASRRVVIMVLVLVLVVVSSGGWRVRRRRNRGRITRA